MCWAGSKTPPRPDMSTPAWWACEMQVGQVQAKAFWDQTRVTIYSGGSWSVAVVMFGMVVLERTRPSNCFGGISGHFSFARYSFFHSCHSPPTFGSRVGKVDKINREGLLTDTEARLSKPTAFVPGLLRLGYTNVPATRRNAVKMIGIDTNNLAAARRTRCSGASPLLWPSIDALKRSVLFSLLSPRGVCCWEI